LDRITIRKLTAELIIGTFPEERNTPQTIIADIDIFCDLEKAGRSDDLADTVDYFELESRMYHLMTGSCFYLLEKLAQEMADSILADQRIKECRIRLVKPAALQHSGPAEIEITRYNGTGSQR
jgi:FolB domain-containing protein